MLRWIAAATFSLLATQAAAATLYVNPGGTGGCFSSVQAAVDAAGNRDVIDIAAGTCVGSVSVLGFTRLTLQGAGAGSTILQGPLGILHVSSGDVVVQGVTLSDSERAILVSTGKLTLRDSTITGNTGAAVECAKGTRVTIEDCLIAGNGESLFYDAAVGGRGAVTIVRSEIRDNQSHGVTAEGKVTIVDSVIRGNGNTGVRVNVATITGSTISGNGVSFPSGGVSIGLDASRGGSAKISNTTISGNAGVGLVVFDRYGAVLDHVTIAGNTQPLPGATTGGLQTLSKRVVLRRTVMADNLPTDCATPSEFSAGHIRLAGVNLIETPGDCVTAGQAPLTVDPVLGPL